MEDQRSREENYRSEVPALGQHSQVPPRYERSFDGALAHAYALARSDNNLLVPNPVALRRKVKPWFDLQYGQYAKHHVNPVCRTAVALLRSYRKKHKKLAVPRVRRLAMRIDSE